MSASPRVASVSEAPLPFVPAHVAIIMDGNGRWAQQRGLPRLAGHRAGTENIRRIIQGCVDFGVQVLTLYAFSTENWRRPDAEVRGLMTILAEVIDRETRDLHKNGVRLRHIGELAALPASLRERVERAVYLTRDNSRLTLNVAFNYGGRSEIVRAVQRILESGMAPSAVTEEVIDEHLDTAGLPDPDLIIRTAGEMRLSNFLLWQAAYAEYWSTPIFWPEFGRDNLYQALCDFAARQRRFGSL
ncbi:MAG: polyprenyl diphosphate synthase [Chloroflexota bacterium]